MDNKGLKIGLVILIVITLILGSYIVYDKLMKEDTKVCDKDNFKCDNDLINTLVGTYTYEGEYVEKEKNASGENKLEDDAYTSGKMAIEELVLNKDGTATASASNVRASGYNTKGKWYISNNEIIILNDSCNATVSDGKVTYPNCQPIWTYEYKLDNNNIVVTSKNNTLATVDLIKNK